MQKSGTCPPCPGLSSEKFHKFPQIHLLTHRRRKNELPQITTDPCLRPREELRLHLSLPCLSQEPGLRPVSSRLGGRTASSCEVWWREGAAQLNGPPLRPPGAPAKETAFQDLVGPAERILLGGGHVTAVGSATSASLPRFVVGFTPVRTGFDGRFALTARHLKHPTVRAKRRVL